MGEGRHTAEVADLLERAAARLEKPLAWTQVNLAAAIDGRPLLARSPAAVCWCALGALIVESGGGDVMALASDAVRSRLGAGSSVAEWNDAPGRTQAEVVAELRAAAADLRAEAQS